MTCKRDTSMILSGYYVWSDLIISSSNPLYITYPQVLSEGISKLFYHSVYGYDTQKSLYNFSTGSGDNCRITRQIGEALCEAISSYCANDFDAVITRLAPIRKKIYEIGGSNAQVFFTRYSAVNVFFPLCTTTRYFPFIVYISPTIYKY